MVRLDSYSTPYIICNASIQLLSSGSFADSKPHYPLLDGLRGVAAIVVVWYHIFESFATSHLDQGVNHGYLAVDFFFLLSGFVLGYAYDGRWGKMSTWSFIRRRLIRLHPMVIFGAIFGGALFYTQGCEAWDVSKISIGMLLVGILLNALMIPAPTRMDVRGLGEIYPLNGPTWSLFFEYIGNLLYAIILRRLPLWGLRLIVLISGLGLIGVAVYGTQGDLCLGWAFTPENALGGSLRLLFSMTMGLLLSRTLHTCTVRGSFALGAGLFVLLAVLPRLGEKMPFGSTGSMTACVSSSSSPSYLSSTYDQRGSALACASSAPRWEISPIHSIWCTTPYSTATTHG